MGLVFHKKWVSLHFGQKILRRGCHFTKISKTKKMIKSAIFEVEKPLEMCPNLPKFQKTAKSAVFWMRKILRYRQMFQTSGCIHTHPIKNDLSFPLTNSYPQLNYPVSVNSSKHLVCFSLLNLWAFILSKIKSCKHAHM